jgi:hypothetical protein
MGLESTIGLNIQNFVWDWQLLSTTSFYWWRLASQWRLAIFELDRYIQDWYFRENMRRRATIFTMKQTDARITELLARLTELERGRAEIVAEINTLRLVQREGTAATKVVLSEKAGDPTDRNSPIEKKIALFRRLFRGRPDVFPVRWRIARQGAADTHPLAPMNGSVGFAKNRK